MSIVPVIAKSDCLTMSEIKKLKARILEEIKEAGIKIYNLPDVDSDEDEEYKQQVAQLRESIPFAVCGANAMVEVGGKKVIFKVHFKKKTVSKLKVRGRQYPWGIVDVENPEHCDFIKLRSMLITHMQDLQEVNNMQCAKECFITILSQVTHDVHYENFRSERLAKGSTVAPPSEKTDQKDQMLAEKDEELRRMQEMLAKMQQQMKQQSSTNLASFNN